MEKKKASEPVADINVTPMVDVMLVLLIIFIVITPMLSKGISVEMAKTNNPAVMQAADKEDAVLVAIARDGRTYLGTDQMSPDTLPGKVKDLLTNKLDKTVYLRSDARARWWGWVWDRSGSGTVERSAGDVHRATRFCADLVLRGLPARPGAAG